MTGCASGQNRIHPNIAALDNDSIRRTEHLGLGFELRDDVLRKVKRHKERYSKYFFDQLEDTSKTIVAHFLLLVMTGDTLSILDKPFLNDESGRSGIKYRLSGLEFTKYLNGKYVVDTESIPGIRNRWIEVLGEP